MTCVQLNKDGSIAASADWAFPGSTRVDYEVVRGYDGRLYKAGTEPARPAEEVEAELFARLRAERDRRLALTDYAMMPDYPLTSERKVAVTIYRQALRDLPEQNGAPWDGGGEATPWPQL